MVNHRQIRQCLRKQLLTLPALVAGGVTMSWENKPFKPPAQSGLWLREAYMPVSETRNSVGFIEALGIYQISAFVGMGLGSEDLDDAASAVLGLFPPGASLLDGSMQVAIDHCERKPGRDAGALIQDQSTWFMVPVEIRWRTYASTPF